MGNQQPRSWSYLEITARTERTIGEVLESGGEHAGGWQSHAVAYGVYLAWSQLTGAERTAADDERLHRLVRHPF